MTTAASLAKRTVATLDDHDGFRVYSYVTADGRNFLLLVIYRPNFGVVYGLDCRCLRESPRLGPRCVLA